MFYLLPVWRPKQNRFLSLQAFEKFNLEILNEDVNGFKVRGFITKVLRLLLTPHAVRKI
jgi:hypothetical protein